MSKRAYEEQALVGTIDPVTVSTTELFTDVIDMSKYDAVQFIFAVGNMGAADIIARVVTCDSAGNNAAAFKTATTLAAHATNNDAKQIIIEVAAEDLAGGTALTADRYVKGGIVSGTNAGPVACLAMACRPKDGPANDGDLASVVEIEIDKD